MSTWQIDLLEHLRARLPDAEVTAYGSATDPKLLDRWSDLDVAMSLHDSIELEALIDTPLWAFQETSEGATQIVRAVLADGRRVDLTVQGASAELPRAPIDNAIRFDAALAAVRFGRGNDLIGLHLTLGILREALVQSMISADREHGRSHHRYATIFDPRAEEALAVLRPPSGPRTALSAYAVYARWRQELEPDYEPAPEGLEALIESGEGRRLL
ncbi:hypothetical protein [Brachybacterium phenoliresistens]|uniref:Polymerase nucleotidyl transferase domain-containing protein n=1 Tax=Brachybacterium phenoliresistens TaxID=396014 RepID=Z9JSS9_9MICO|nr:hypothetical protein [Brachybacterium phenoliresistens]EWS81259.1 hypothetical protein BF93_17750 [Brachybacterium phenoliresistens]